MRVPDRWRKASLAEYLGTAANGTLPSMKDRGSAEFPGRLTGEVILYSEHYAHNEKAEQRRREQEAAGRRRRWWRIWRRRPSAR